MAHVPNPLIDLTTLADLKEWLTLPDPSSVDDLLQMLITAESSFIQEYCNRFFISQPWTETRDGSGSNAMLFREYPVTSVQAVTVYATNIPYAPSPFNPVNLTGAPSFWGSPAYPTGYYFTNRRLLARLGAWPQGPGNVVISYTAGYAAPGTTPGPGVQPLPASLQQAALELTAFRYMQQQRKYVGGGQTLDGQSVQFGGAGSSGQAGSAMGDMPQSVKTAIQTFRRVTQILPSEF